MASELCHSFYLVSFERKKKKKKHFFFPWEERLDGMFDLETLLHDAVLTQVWIPNWQRLRYHFGARWWGQQRFKQMNVE